jgi:hypothetical protein
MFVLNLGNHLPDYPVSQTLRPEVRFLVAVERRKCIVVHDIWGFSSR